MLANDVIRQSPAYEQLQDLGAEMIGARGWQMPLYFESNADRSDEYDIPNHIDESPAVGVEHLAARDNVVLGDIIVLAPIEIRGPAASELVQWAFSNDMEMEVGSSTYAVMLNREGGIMGDYVVSRLEDNRFWAFTVGGTIGAEHTAWLQNIAPEGVTVCNLDNSYTCIGLWGPNAGDVIQPLADEDISREGFPYFGVRELEIQDIPVIAVRVSYVGEYGWELWTPLGYETQLWNELWDAGQDHGITPFGLGALLSTSMEKDYRLPGTDVTAERNPFEAKLHFVVDMDTDFIGRDALEDIREEGVDERIACITMSENILPDVGDVVYADDKVVSEVVRSGYGYHVKENIVNAYMPVDHTEPGTTVEIETDGERWAATVRDPPLFDPDDERLR